MNVIPFPERKADEDLAREVLSPLSLRDRALIGASVFAVVAMVCAFWLSVAVVIVRAWGL